MLLIVLFSCDKIEGQRVNSDIQIPQKKLSYSQILLNIENFRERKSKEFRTTSSEEEKDKVLQECRDSLFVQLKNNVFPAWYGTEWHFSGITPEPKLGSYPAIAQSVADTNRIACGYFITRILSKMQFKINPYKVAQQNSRIIVLNFVKKKDVFYSNNEKVAFLKEKLREKGKGIYVVGLDCHTGFIVYDGKEYFRFVHSSYYDPPFSVVSENLDTFNPLNHSKGRIIGKLFDDDMIRKWLLNEKFKLITL